MPELPEVETIRRGLLEQIRDARIDDLEARACRVFKVAPERLLETLPGQRVRDLTRRGKFLVAHLDRHFLVVHLGMTGQLTVRDPARPDSQGFIRHPVTGLQRARQHAPDPHTHLILGFQDGRHLLYRDSRKFGRIDLLSRDPDALDRYFGNLGLEPFSEQYTPEAFLKRLRDRRTRVKPLLLDQSVVAGVGNIYADEALFAASIHPLRRVHRLRKWEKLALHAAVLEVLRQGIDFGGSSLRDYIDSEGRRGSNQEELKVYGRQGLPCAACGTAVAKIVVGQRGTHFCPRCQPRGGRARRRRRDAGLV